MTKIKKGDQPWIKFFYNDWLNDTNLRACGAAARGTWMDMLCLMCKSEKPGIFVVKDNAMSDQKVAEALPGNTDEVLKHLKELEENGVFSRNEQEAIYSRRMVDDHTKSQIYRNNVSKRYKSNAKKKPDTQDILKDQKAEAQKEKEQEDIKKPPQEPPKKPKSEKNQGVNNWIKYIPKGMTQYGIEYIFKEFMNLYPGNKTSFNFDFGRLHQEKYCKKVAEIVPLLKPALIKEIQHREALKSIGEKFIPDWKMLSTWLNKTCWEQEFEKVEINKPKLMGPSPSNENNEPVDKPVDKPIDDKPKNDYSFLN